MQVLAFLAGCMLGAGIACIAIARVLFKIAAKAAAAKPVAPVLPIGHRPIFLSPSIGVA
jgi:hypothetical protein